MGLSGSLLHYNGTVQSNVNFIKVKNFPCTIKENFIRVWLYTTIIMSTIVYFYFMFLFIMWIALLCHINAFNAFSRSCMYVCVCVCAYNGLFIYLLMASDIYNVQTCEPHLLNGKKKGEMIAEKE